MSVKREMIIEQYVLEIGLDDQQRLSLCYLIELIPANILVRPLVVNDLSKGMSERAVARKWGINESMAHRISKLEPEKDSD